MIQSSEKLRLGDILVIQNTITLDQLGQALTLQKINGRKLGRILVDSGYTTETLIAQALAQQFEVPYIDLITYDVKPAITQKLPESQARRFRALVLDETPANYVVALTDPTDTDVKEQLSHILGKPITLSIIREDNFLACVDDIYKKKAPKSSTELDHDTKNVSPYQFLKTATERVDENNTAAVVFDTNNNLTQINTNANNANLSTINIDDVPVVKLLQSIFVEAVKSRVSDIHIEPQEHTLHVRFRVDGMMHLHKEVEPKLAASLVMRLKVISELDISEKRLPQDGRYSLMVEQQSVDVRISTMPTQYGESVVMRLLIMDNSNFSLDRLGMPTDMLNLFRKLLQRPSGMVLVTGPTGSGKTSTLYAALNELKSVTNKIITVEDPVEYRLAGINQVQVNEKIDLDFPRVLRAMLRQDPDIILVGEMRDQQTAEIGLKAAMTGHLVLSTLHTNNAASSPIRLIDMGTPRFMVAMSVTAVLAQRLVRQVCKYCAKSHTPDAFEIAWLKAELGNVDLKSLQFVTENGCNNCNHTGYQGRAGVYELLEMTHELTDAINQTDPSLFIKLSRQAMLGKTLRSSLVNMACAKRTTLAEAMRISNEFED